MKIVLLTRLSTTLFLAMLLLAGCKKETSESLTPQQEEEAAGAAAQSQAESEFVFNDVFDNVMGVNTEVGIGGTGIFGKRAPGVADGAAREMDLDSASCWTVAIVRLNAPSIFPVRITIDFGAGCTGADGHVRSGKIITDYSARLIIPGASATTRFENFKIDDISVRGIHEVTNTSASTPGSNGKQFTVKVKDARLSRPDGNYTEWKSERIFTQIEGNGTILPFDDVLSIKGAAEGRVKRGNYLYGWHSEIPDNNPLIKRFTCHWISKGAVKTWRDTLSPNSPWTAVLDFGNGACDFAATLTINGTVHPIQLPH